MDNLICTISIDVIPEEMLRLTHHNRGPDLRRDIFGDIVKEGG